MSTPDFDYLKPKLPIAGQEPQTGGPTFDYLKPKAPIEPMGFFEYTRNMATGLYDLYSAITPEAPKNERQLGLVQLLSERGEVDPITMEDFKLTFQKTFADLKNTAQVLKDSPGEMKEALFGNPAATVGQLAKFIVEPIGDLIEAGTAVQLSDGSYRHLTAEERANKIKNGVAFAASLGVGAAAHSMLKVGAASEAMALAKGTMSMAKVTDIANKSGKVLTKGAIATKLAKETAVGAAAGVTYSGVRYIGEDDHLAQMILDGVVFAPFGTAFGVLGLRGEGKLLRNNREVARDVFNLRQQRAIGESTLGDIGASVSSLASADNIAQAVLDKHIQIKPDDMLLLKGVSKDKVLMLNMRRTSTHMVTSGAHDKVLILGHERGLLVDAQRRFFEDTGQLPNKVVSYRGKEWVIGESYNLKDNTIDIFSPDTPDKRISVPLNEVADLPAVRFNDAALEFETHRSLKGRFLSEAKALGYKTPEEMIKGSYNNSWLQAEMRSLSSKARTGEPISLIAARAEGRSALGKVTGHFYTDDLGGGLEYTRIIHARELAGKRKSLRIELTRREKFNPATALQRFKVHRLEFENPLVFPATTSIDTQFAAIKYFRDNHPEFKAELAEADAAWRMHNSSASKTQDALNKTGERGYQFTDRAIAKMARKAGFDGIVYRGGAEIVDLRALTRIDKARRGFHVAKHRTLKAGTADANLFIDRLYEGFNDRIAAYLFDTADLNAPLNYDKVLKDYLADHGLRANEVPALRREFAKRIKQRFMNDIEPDERAWLERIERIADENLRRTTDNDIRTIAKAANSNGMYIDVEDAGKIVIRDMDTHDALSRPTSMDDAITFINESGQELGFNLDDGILPPIFGDLVDNFRDPWPSDPLGSKNRLQIMVDALNTTATFLTRNREVQIAYDNQFNTKFLARIFDPTQESKMRAQGLQTPYVQQLKKLDEAIAGMGKVDREKIGQWLETMAPDEVLQRGGPGGRALTTAETDVARRFLDTNVDLKKVFLFRRLSKDQEKIIRKQELPGDEHTVRFELNRYQQQLRKELNINEADLEAVRTLTVVERQPIKDISIGGITRYYRSLKNGELSRADFAKQNNLSKKQLQLGHALDQMYKDLAKTFDIDPNLRLDNFMTHARLHTDGNIEGALNAIGIADPQTKEFYGKLIRTGEISAYETDPIIAMSRYIKAGFDEQTGFNRAISEARSALGEEIKEGLSSGRIPPDVVPRMKEIVENYLSDVQGHADSARNSTQGIFDNMIKELGLADNVSVNVRRQVVNFLSSTFEAGAQGLRLAAGIRDLASGLIVSIASYGPVRTAEVLNYGVAGMNAKGLDAIGLRSEIGPAMNRATLKAAGVIPESGIVNFADPTEYAQSVMSQTRGKVATKVSRMNQRLFELSGQKSIYAMLHTGHYISTWKRVGNGLKKLNDGTWTREQFDNHIDLHTYDQPVIDEFNRLLADSPDPSEAARFLGRQTGQDMVGVYGLANHAPGWNTNLGRLFGQFGQWSLWFKGEFLRMATRGTGKQRMLKVARLLAAQKAMTVVGGAAGFNLEAWQPTTGILFGGGPIVDTYQIVSDAMSGYGFLQEDGRRKLEHLLPWNNVGQLYIPGSFFVRDVLEAVELADQGEDLHTILGRGVGIKVNR